MSEGKCYEPCHHILCSLLHLSFVCLPSVVAAKLLQPRRPTCERLCFPLPSHAVRRTSLARHNGNRRMFRRQQPTWLPTDAPNIVIILLDHVVPDIFCKRDSFANSSTSGGYLGFGVIAERAVDVVA